jgi:DNA-binding transcriptional ArsR family regulator
MAKVREEHFDEIADRFKALAEPARLRILTALREGELTVGELVARTGLNQANLSKHLQLLHTLRFVARRKDGVFVRYRLLNNDVFVLCDIMCGAAEASVAAPAARVQTTRRTAAAVRARR